MTSFETFAFLLALLIVWGLISSLDQKKVYNLHEQSYFFRPLNLGSHGHLLVCLPGLNIGDFLWLRNTDHPVLYSVLSIQNILYKKDLFQITVLFEGQEGDFPISFNSKNEKTYLGGF